MLEHMHDAEHAAAAFDWGFVRYFQNKHIDIIVPRHSLALHYGMYGAHGTGNHVEVANNFDLTPFPQRIADKANAFLLNKSPDKPPHCDNTPTGSMWQAFTSIINILERTHAKYSVGFGTALQWYRDCTLGSSDVDVHIDLEWLANHQDTPHSDKKDGPCRRRSDSRSNRDTKKRGHFEESNATSSPLRQTKPQDSPSTTSPTCAKASTRTLKNKRWNNVNFNTPAPIETYLENMYGDWKVKHTHNYMWDQEPFKSDRHFCSHDELADLADLADLATDLADLATTRKHTGV